MQKDLLLAIDNGTQSARALVFDNKEKMYERLKPAYLELNKYLSKSN